MLVLCKANVYGRLWNNCKVLCKSEIKRKCRLLNHRATCCWSVWVELVKPLCQDLLRGWMDSAYSRSRWVKFVYLIRVFTVGLGLACNRDPCGERVCYGLHFMPTVEYNMAVEERWMAIEDHRAEKLEWYSWLLWSSCMCFCTSDQANRKLRRLKLFTTVLPLAYEDKHKSQSAIRKLLSNPKRIPHGS